VKKKNNKSSKEIKSKMQPTLSEYLEGLSKRYKLHYNVETNKLISEKKIDIYAISVLEHYRHVLTKKIQIDRYQEKEIIFVQGFEQFVDDRIINDFSQFLINITRELVIPSFEVMSHTINGIIVSAQGFSQEAIAITQRFRYGKTFVLGIKGWCDIRLLLIDLKQSCVYCNPKGKEIASVYNFKKELGGGKKQSVIN
jgi:hypothetical protein